MIAPSQNLYAVLPRSTSRSQRVRGQGTVTKASRHPQVPEALHVSHNMHLTDDFVGTRRQRGAAIANRLCTQTAESILIVFF